MNTFLTTVFLVLWFNALSLNSGEALNRIIVVGLVALAFGAYGCFLDYKELKGQQ